MPNPTDTSLASMLVGWATAGALDAEEVAETVRRYIDDNPERFQELVVALVQLTVEMQHPARLAGERDAWKSIASELLKAAWGDEASTFNVPPLELVQRAGDPPVRANLAQWWADLTFKDSERRSKREFWQEKTAIVEASVEFRRLQKLGGGDQPPQRLRWQRAVDALIAKQDERYGRAELEAAEDIEEGAPVVVGPDGRARTGGTW
jgi:hypothetical protein